MAGYVVESAPLAKEKQTKRARQQGARGVRLRALALVAENAAAIPSARRRGPAPGRAQRRSVRAHWGEDLYAGQCDWRVARHIIARGSIGTPRPGRGDDRVPRHVSFAASRTRGAAFAEHCSRGADTWWSKCLQCETRCCSDRAAITFRRAFARATRRLCASSILCSLRYVMCVICGFILNPTNPPVGMSACCRAAARRLMIRLLMTTLNDEPHLRCEDERSNHAVFPVKCHVAPRATETAR